MERYKILYEDEALFVLWKAAGVPVQSARISLPDVMSLLRNTLLERGVRDPYLGLVNRLDQPVEGLFLAAKEEAAAADLCRQVKEHIHMEKWYQAVLCGKLSKKKGVLVDYLRKDSRTNTSGVVMAGAKDAKKCELSYEVLKEWGDRSLVKIRLLTGRHHQIRVQFAHAGAPVAGDQKYGKAEGGRGQLLLCASELRFRHPRTGESMHFQAEPTFL
ncbi:MAG: RluA family pseudouridine synthase [Lachnospiraceae bacterium]|nr:RluA family pseudouridine synthase [Lachnospiraceae bacterium]